MGKIKMEAKIIRQDEIATDIYSMVIQAPEIASQAVPGQFIDVYSADGSKVKCLAFKCALAGSSVLGECQAQRVFSFLIHVIYDDFPDGFVVLH